MSYEHEQWYRHRQLLDRSPKVHSRTGHRLDNLPSPPVSHPRLETLMGGPYRIAAGARPRKIDYAPNTPPIWDQGQRGTCTAHGATRAVCYRFISAGQEPEGDLSREFAYWAAKQLDGMPGQDGSTSWAAWQGFVKYGCPPAPLDQYNPGESDLALTPPSAAALSAAAQWKIPSFAQLLNAGDPERGDYTIETICNALWLYGPLSVAHMVCQNFVPDPKTSIIPLPAGSLEGGHEECIVGYDDDARLFRVANSWGPGWGLGGYWLMPYEWIAASYDPVGNGSKAWYVYDSYTTSMTAIPRQAKQIVLTIGSTVAVVDGEQIALDEAPKIDSKTGRTLLPVRAMAGNMGYAVAWEPSSPQITLTRVG